MADSEVVHREAAHRFEIRIGDAIAFLNYRPGTGKLTLIHTEVPHALQEHGIGGKLAQAAFDYARSAGLRVNPLCPFAAAWVAKHPEYADLVVH